MRTNLKKVTVLFSAICILGALATGCSPNPAPATKTVAEDTGNGAGTQKPQENAGGKWHVLEPEIAAAVDADFMGKVWHIAEGAFSIAETNVKLLDDGSIASSSPSSNAKIPDSQLVHVIFNDDTLFYIRTISDNGESYEDTEAGFGDLREHMSVEMKGSFEKDVFHATEVRIVKVS